MAKIKPKLYLNMSPQTQEEGSLAFARNMKVDTDGNLVSDYGYKNISPNDLSATPRALSNYNIVGHIVGLDNKIYFFTDNNVILEYDELTEKITKQVDGYWNYGGGEIDGYVSTNQSGEKILTIAEYKENGKTPLKHINLSYYDVADESLYCQAPKVPMANLNLKGTYVKTIPNGVYVFFIRYKIRKGVYTNWFLCSRPIFGGVSDEISTLQGGLKYINYHKDSAKSFIFDIDFAIPANQQFYKEFQLGFIITHDDSTNARSWKTFTMPSAGTSLPIYFDYENVQDVNIDDLLASTYELYNVRNVTSFKNKLYIGNYIESDFNPDLAELAKCISLSVVHSNGSADDTRDMTYNGTKLHYNYDKGYYDGTGSTTSDSAIKDLISKADFNYNISKLAKGTQREKDNVASFKLKWLASENPDVADVYSIQNSLENNAIFGSDSLETYEFLKGCTQLSSGGNLWVYGPSASPHPFYKKGITFAYGSATEEDMKRNGYCGNGSYFFNVFSRHSYRSGDPSILGWTTRNKGFNDYSRSGIDANIKKEIKGLSFFAKCYLEVSSGGNVYRIGYESRMDDDNYVGRYNREVTPGTTGDYYLTVKERFDSDTNKNINVEKVAYSIDFISSIDDFISNSQTSLNNCNTEKNTDYLESKIKKWVFDTLKTYIIGFDEVGNPILNLKNEDGEATSVVASTISVIFKKFEFDVENNDLQTDNDHYVKEYNISLKTTDYTSICTFSVKSSIISITNKGVVDKAGHSVSQASTLMPLSKYKAYAHFVDDYGIITNGFPIQEISTAIATSSGDILSLKYTASSDIMSHAAGYKSFFISLANTGNLVVEGFNYTKKGNTTHILNSIEVDALLYNINDNIKIEIYNSVGTVKQTITDAVYYSSGSAYPPLAFGNCGYISWESATDYSGCSFYIIIERNTQNENNLSLYKASAYIPLGVATSKDIPEGFYGSYFCLIKKPDFKLSSSCYVAGSDIYAVNRDATLTLNEFKSFVQIQTSVTRCVRSNFNLNYLSLTEDISDRIFTVGTASSGVKQVAKVINSATLSYIYELKAMYKDFMNKAFRAVETDYKTIFDNTVRVSNVLSDETFNNSIFNFKASDYYNVPTDRGIIVNLFAIGNNIFVHTKAGLYKFDANQTIAASNEDITLQESEPFDIGISQIFDSEFGYGGINNKEAGCITFDSYFFYDQFSNHIFAYSGNGQVVLIDGSIQKILSIYKPTYCRTLHDDTNRRVFFEFRTASNDIFTLSYNYKAKAFISVHDLSLNKAFASRNAAYSYNDVICKLFDTTFGIPSEVYDDDVHILKLFGGATKTSILQFGSESNEYPDTCFGLAVVMFPREYARENIEFVTIDADVIQNPTEVISEKREDVDTGLYGYYFDLIKVPQHLNVNPINKMVLITDCCVSIPVIGTVNDANRPASLKETPSIPNALLDYKGFKYDAGSWNANYFRNALNTNNVYNYQNQPRVSQTPNTDNASLIYGKFFIINLNFITTQPIKIESIFINSNKY